MKLRVDTVLRLYNRKSLVLLMKTTTKTFPMHVRIER